MDKQVPWTGGISNREIVMDSLRGLTVWAAVSFSLFALAWWIASNIPIANPTWRVPICAALAGVIANPVVRWCRAGKSPA